MSDSVNTVVLHLREVSDRLLDLFPEDGASTVFFPPKEGKERQPVRLRGEVPIRDVASLLHYIADMLEE